MRKWVRKKTAICAALIALISAEAYPQRPYFTDCGAQMDWLTMPRAQRPNAQDKGNEFRFAEPNEVNLTPDNAGVMSEFDDGMVTWVVGLGAEWSENINVTFANVELGVGEYIYVYSPDGAKVQTFTMRDNPRNGYLQSMPVEGDSVVVEYQSLRGTRPRFTIEAVNCGFLPFDQEKSQKASAGDFGSSEECEVNASCNSDVEDITRATCRLLINGTSLGTGVLINNTAQDGKPYVITAAHVFTNNTLKTCVARFNYDAPLCQDKVYYSDYEDISGATLVSFHEQRDVALLLLDEAPSDRTRPYWAGWNASGDFVGDHCIGVHHPYGDVHKVSVGTVPVQSTYSGKTNSNLSMSPNAHWHVGTWTSGTTEGGSSGSGLFDAQKRLIGCLTGGSATCSYPQDDYYWRLASSWKVSGTGDKTIYEALNPTESNVTQLDGAEFVGTRYSNEFNSGIETSILSLTDEGDYLAGHNSRQISAVAERFGNESGATKIHGIYIAPARARQKYGNAYRIFIWSDSNGEPGDEVAAFQCYNSLLSTSKVCYLEFENAIAISGAYHLGFELNYTEHIDTLAVYYSASATENTAHFRYNGTWSTYADMTGSEASCTLFLGAKTSGATVDNSLSEVEVESQITVKREGEKLIVGAASLVSIEMCDVAGRVRYSNRTLKGQSRCEIELSALPTGMFLVKVEAEGEKKTFKVLGSR